MDDWKRVLAESITKPKDLAKHLGVDPKEVEQVVGPYPMRITPTVLATIKAKGDAIWKQVVPDSIEMEDFDAPDDPLEEDTDSPVPHLVHRYPDRALLMVTNQCPIYCRFCTRKRLVGKPGFLKKGELDQAIAYLHEHREVRDVILSGGDPLLLPDHLIERILKALRTIPHLELIRFGTRVPGTLPQRITPELCEIVKQYHPIYMNLHFNHPDELTPEVKEACGRLADAGVPLGAQTVLLKGVNDDPEIMKQLMQQLLLARVKPYYLYQADLTKGTNHFRTTVETGLQIIQALQGHTSGMAVPHFVIDAPGGGGKIPLLPPDYLLNLDENGAVLKNYENKTYHYPQPDPQPDARSHAGTAHGRHRRRRGTLQPGRHGRVTMGSARKHGILSDTHLKTLIREHAIDAAPAITESQIQPASVDLRLGTKAYRLISSFLPERSEIGARLNVLDLYQSELVMYDMDLTQGAILEKGHVYLVPLLEHVALPSHVRGRANPKSSTGRLDIFTRLITDLNAGFDEIPPGYRGPLYLEIVPRSFTIRVQTGLALNQLRLLTGRSTVSDSKLRALHRSAKLLYHNDDDPDARPLATQDIRVDHGLFSGDRLAGFRRGPRDRGVSGEKEQSRGRFVEDRPLFGARLLGTYLPAAQQYVVARARRVLYPGFS